MKEKTVIKFAGKKGDLVWIYPQTTIRQDATVHVEMGYQAIMVRNSEMDIPYFPGTNKAFKEKQNKKYVGDCKIYFFNKSRDVSAREWGTRYPIKFFDKRYKLELTMRGHGTYKVHLENPRLLLRSFKIDENSIPELETTIKDLVIEKLTQTIAKVLTSEKYDLLSIHACYDGITKGAQELLNADFESYGFSIFDLRISSLAPVEEEQIKVLKELHFKSAVFDTEFEMANKVRQANNEDILVQNQVNEIHCTNCNAAINRDMVYCSNCGHKLKKTENGD